MRFVFIIIRWTYMLNFAADLLDAYEQLITLHHCQDNPVHPYTHFK